MTRALSLDSSSELPVATVPATKNCCSGKSLLTIGIGAVALFILGASSRSSENRLISFLRLLSAAALLLILGIAITACRRRNSLADEIRSSLKNQPKPLIIPFSALSDHDYEMLASRQGIVTANKIIDNIYIGNRMTLRWLSGMPTAPREALKHSELPGIYDTLPRFTKVISIANPDENERINLPRGVEQLQLFTTDNRYGWRDLKAGFAKAFEMIDKARSAKCPILVHCQAGVSRSVTLVVAYLISRGHVTVNEGLSFIQKKRHIANPNQYFVNELHQYAEELGIEGDDDEALDDSNEAYP